MTDLVLRGQAFKPFTFWTATCGLLLCACTVASPQPADTARLPTNALSGQDQDVAAIGLAADAFSGPSQTYGRPADAARAAAALEYLAGELATAPRWSCLSGTAQVQLAQARTELRETLDVTPGTRAQQIVDQLERAADALTEDDQPAAVAALGPPAFRSGKDMLTLLGNLPYMQSVNVAMQQVNAETSPGTDTSTCDGAS